MAEGLGVDGEGRNFAGFMVRAAWPEMTRPGSPQISVAAPPRVMGCQPDAAICRLAPRSVGRCHERQLEVPRDGIHAGHDDPDALPERDISLQVRDDRWS